MRIDWWTLGLQTINVVVLVWILSRFLFRPVVAIIEDRQAAVQRMLDDAERQRALARTALDEAGAEARRQMQAREAQLAGARAEGEAAAKGIVDAAHSAAEQAIADAKAEADRMAARARLDLEDRSADLAVDIASTLLARLPPTALVAPFAPGLADEIAALPGDRRAAIGEAPLRLLAPHALSDEEAADVAHALERALGRSVALNLEVDPRLIAGLELETPHAKVSNSFREDLRRIRQELKARGPA